MSQLDKILIIKSKVLFHKHKWN